MNVSLPARAWIAGALLTIGSACAAAGDAQPTLSIVGEASLFARGIASTEFSDVRLTISPDGRTALWFTRNRPGGAGGYDIWMARRTADAWGHAIPVSFNTAQRDFDPAFSPDGRYVYFCSDRPGGLGGDDIYRVAVTPDGFGPAVPLGPGVNSPGNEWAPMLAPDLVQLLFSSNGRGGAGRFDLFTARRQGDATFAAATPLPGKINTAADEFDATFLADSITVIFARAPDIQVDRVDLFHASLIEQNYDAGTMLPPSINVGDQNTYGPMLDWSHPGQLLFSGQRKEARAGNTDLYVVRYRLPHVAVGD